MKQFKLWDIRLEMNEYKVDGDTENSVSYQFCVCFPIDVIVNMNLNLHDEAFGNEYFTGTVEKDDRLRRLGIRLTAQRRLKKW
jgi:hypothetical protein